MKGKTVGIDATTLEANAALRSIVRRDSGESYQEFLTKLAQASGIQTPARADRNLSRIRLRRMAWWLHGSTAPLRDRLPELRKQATRRPGWASVMTFLRSR